MPTVTSPEQLFEHELQDMYYAEKTLTKVLPKLASEASDAELSRAFTSHQKETEKHVRNLEQVFTKIGKRPQATPCPGIEGIKKEHARRPRTRAAGGRWCSDIRTRDLIRHRGWGNCDCPERPASLLNPTPAAPAVFAPADAMVRAVKHQSGRELLVCSCIPSSERLNEPVLPAPLVLGEQNAPKLCEGVRPNVVERP